MTGAGADNCTVTLTAAAPAAGVVVTLASSNPAVTVPASVTIPGWGCQRRICRIGIRSHFRADGKPDRHLQRRYSIFRIAAERGGRVPQRQRDQRGVR